MRKEVKRPAKAARKSAKALAPNRGQGWLAKQLGVTQQRVSKLIKREGWRWPRSGWTKKQVGEIRAWLVELREENPATEMGAIVGAAAGEGAGGGGGGEEGGGAGGALGEFSLEEMNAITDPRDLLKWVHKPELRIKLLGVIERAAKVKVDRELVLGGYLKKDDVEAGRVARVQAVRAELANVRLLAIKLEGKSVIEMEKELEEWARGVCQKFERAGV